MSIEKTRGIAVVALMLAIGMPAFAAEPLLRIYTNAGSLDQPIWTVPVSKGAPADPAILYRSTDGGLSWQTMNSLPSASVEPASILNITEVGNGIGATHLFVGTDGEGVYRSTDDGFSWQKWNDADVGILALISSQENSYVAALTTDRATFRTSTAGDVWVQIFDLPITASVLFQHLSNTFVGTEDGKIFIVRQDATDIEELTTGALGGLSRLPGPVRAMADMWFNPVVTVEHADGSYGLYKSSSIAADIWHEVAVNGQHANAIALAANSGHIVILNAQPDLELLYSIDGAQTWNSATLPVVDGINELTLGRCSEADCFPNIILATDEGGFVSEDGGMNWVAFTDLAAAGPRTDGGIESDVGIEMVSPVWETTAVARSTTRFELKISNSGPEDLSDVTATIEFTQWRTGSNFGKSVWATSGVTIDGEECDKSHDGHGDPIHICTLPELAANDSVSLVVRHSLPADATSMRIKAAVQAANLNDTFPNNNGVLFQPMVRAQTEVSGGEGGGGGSIGSFMVISLLFRCMIGALSKRPGSHNVQPERIYQQENHTSLADNAAACLYRRIFRVSRLWQAPARWLRRRIGGFR